MSDEWLIYGANGYTGRLIVEEARHRGMRPVLGGRSASAITRMSGDTGLKHDVLKVDEGARLRRHLKKYALVLNCAGPFSATAQPMIDACIDTKTHYIDITGEIDVFEYAQSRHVDAVANNIIVCPGVGFDVVPTDCIAATLKQAMDNGTHLALGFDSSFSLSPGTAKTSVSKLPNGGTVRRDGKLMQVPLAYHTRRIDFGNGEKTAMTIPWGDVATAFYTTGIPNIEAYIPASDKLITKLRRLNLVRGALGWGWVQNIMRKKIDQKVHGPTRQQRENDTVHVWGEIRNEAGDVRTARVKTANGYQLTMLAAVEITQHLLKKQQVSGTFTPAGLMGAHFVSTLEGSSVIEII